MRNEDLGEDQIEDNDNKDKGLEIIDQVEGLDIDEEEKEKVIRQLIMERFSGPLPPPRLLEGYDNLVDDGAERIFRLFEKQSNHRMKLDSK